MTIAFRSARRGSIFISFGGLVKAMVIAAQAAVQGHA